MNWKVKILILMGLLIVLTMFVVCVKHPIILENVFTQSNANFKMYKRLAVAEFTPNPLVKKAKKITDVFEDEFRKKGYDVVGVDKVNSVLKDFGFSGEDLSNPEVMKKVCKRLDAEAIFRGAVPRYEVKKRNEYFPVPAGDVMVIVGGKVYYCDISLMIEMLEAQEGNKMWSCSISCSKKKGKPEKLVKTMIRSSLNTIPQK